MKGYALVLAAALAGACGASWAQAEGEGKNGNGADFFAGWGVGLAVLKPRLPSVNEASVVNNVLRVSSDSRQETSILVSKQFYLFSDGEPCLRHPAFSTPAQAAGAAAADGGKKEPSVMDGAIRTLRRCVGVMVGAGLGSSNSGANSNLVNFVGVGITVGSGVQRSGDSGWHFGLGLGRKFNTRLLGDGLADGAPMPEGETQVRYRVVDVEAKFLYFSTHW